MTTWLGDILCYSGQVGVSSRTAEERTEALLESVQREGTHVMFENKEVVAWTIQNTVELRNKARKCSQQRSLISFTSEASSIPPEQDPYKGVLPRLGVQ